MAPVGIPSVTGTGPAECCWPVSTTVTRPADAHITNPAPTKGWDYSKVPDACAK